MRGISRVAGATAAVALAGSGLVATFGNPAGAAPSTPGVDLQRVTADDSVAKQAVAALRQHASLADLTDKIGLRPTLSLVDHDGDTHVRMQRTYRGLKVIGGDLVVHRTDAGTSVSQTLTKPLDLSITPAISAAKAAAAALTKDATTKQIKGLKAGDAAPKLVVDARSGTPRLAYQVTTGGTYADGTPSRLLTYVDASSGKITRRVEQIETDSGEGQTLYSGTVPLNVTKSGSTYQLKDASRGGTYTTDMKNASDSVLCQLLGLLCSTGTQVTSSTTTFGDGTEANRASAAADAQYGTDETWDFYKSTFGRNGIFGDGSGSYNRVHYGSNYVNAFWDGTKMTYGDGDGVSYGPLTSLDVAGHEMSHGVTENTAGLEYDGESGGLNESTSDILGTMVEFFADNPKDPGDYLIGEQFVKGSTKPLRRMDDPASDGQSANCWSSDVANLDVHYSSGVGNHFYYLLAEGSGQKTIGGVVHNSPTCDGSTVTGIGRDEAEQIWYRALTTYFTSSTDYHGARTATLQAASDLYGSGSTEYNAVNAAWKAVSVS